MPNLLSCISFSLCLVNEAQDLDLKALAIKAYQSFIRSYATHTKSTKHIFHVKNLHLGHISKSFGLKEPPTELVRARLILGDAM